MYWIMIIFFGGKNFTYESDERYIINNWGDIDSGGDIEWEATDEEEISLFKTETEAKGFVQNHWDMLDLECECEERDYKGIRFILRNTKNKKDYKIILEATF